ncbi:MAG: hypothetical protein ALECFALPRED_006499 [Alectoria fallacina]|uniref:Uncharacterized protein n=1 Tax=Alectoria fallacina TaxID=1903189 RepID=A0A8H3G0C4_9LECA|nr:MAG: hypothetical protein ALECFALPRED_006499 [Alectoria fallacina]
MLALSKEQVASKLVGSMSLTFALQALLARHEAYIAEAAEERRKMVGSIEKLETDKKKSETSNVRTIEENRYLLDQLEEMNNTVSNSDAQILSLNATLQSTRKELERLTILAAQTSNLEAQLSCLESEAADLHHQLASREEEEQTVVQRWKGAERTISTLQEQLDQIDKEAREERLRHAEVVKRFERQRAVERELENAAGRLKGAAAATTLGKDGGNSVVSHFVKDILQDNTNLQLGIVELREMLMGSNEEVENLREQMVLHQPVQPYPKRAGSREDLNSELARTPANEGVLSPDFHVHHHYHAAPKVKTARERPVGLARTKKRRNINSPGLRTPSSGTQTPRIRQTPSSPSRQIRTGSSAAAIMSHTTVTIPPVQPHRWSSQSSQAPSSLPSSPQSAFRNPSVFDTIEDNVYSSRPTTPGSIALGSPSIYARHSKRNSDVSARSLSAQTSSSVPQSISEVLQAVDRHGMDDSTETIKFPILDHSIILEEPEDDSTISFLDNHFDPYRNAQQTYSPMEQMRSRLHRASSHESILSSRGMDIPKLRGKHSQGFNPRSSFGPSIASIGPVTSSTGAVAHASKRDRGYDSSNYNRLLLSHASRSPAAPVPTTTAEKSTLGKRVGGWVFGKWGVAPTKSAGNLRAIDALSAAVDERSIDKRKGGSDRGRKTENRLSTHVEAVTIDSLLLKESLEG